MPQNLLTKSRKTMDDLSGVINQILGDPDRMEQIMNLAKTFGGSETTSVIPEISPERIEEIGNILRQTEKSEKKQEALVRALRPYLRPGRQIKLDKALQLVRLSHLAGLAWKNESRSGEVDNV